VYELLTGETPFDAESPQRTFNNIMNREPRFPRSMHPQAQSLIKGLLRKDPRWRLGTELPLRDNPGAGVGSASAGSVIREHGFFHMSSRLDWAMLERKAIPAPWIPNLDGTGMDMRYVDPTFAEADATDTPAEMSQTAEERERWDNFTFVLRSPSPSQVEAAAGQAGDLRLQSDRATPPPAPPTAPSSTYAPK
jgi:RAC serine/threonine-protein kinase